MYAFPSAPGKLGPISGGGAGSHRTNVTATHHGHGGVGQGALPQLDLSRVASGASANSGGGGGSSTARRRGHGGAASHRGQQQGHVGYLTARATVKEREERKDPGMFGEATNGQTRSGGGSYAQQQSLGATAASSASSSSVSSSTGQSRSSRRHGGGKSGGGGGGGGGDPAGSLPLSPHAALKMYGQNFTEYEQSEVLDFPHVYFTGHISAKTRSPSNAAYNHGFDDERGDYTLAPKDHIGYRFEVLGLLGKGSFGQVAKCYDFKKNKLIALKIIRNKKRFHHQALVEVKILETIRDRDVDDNSGAIHIGEHFYFRNHLCITFDLLSINLYEFIKNNNFHGLSLGLIRRFAVQLLTTLRYLRTHSIIHCDLKPENILLRHPNKVGIKVIDFGSSCLEHERVYTYIQSRFYRSPEVILGLPYACPIDMWSLGCILAELYTGYPLFPGESEVEQLLCIMEVMDVPPRQMVQASTRRGVFFDGNGSPRIVPNSRGKKRRPGTRELGHALKCSDQAFVSFLRGCLQWEPEDRMTPDQALAHEFVADGGGSRARPNLPDPRRHGRRGGGGGASAQPQQLPSIGSGNASGGGGGYGSGGTSKYGSGGF